MAATMVLSCTTALRKGARGTMPLLQARSLPCYSQCLAKLSSLSERSLLPSSSAVSSTEEPTTFKVTEIQYATGEFVTRNLKTSELLQTMFARDLFALNITSRQERKLKKSLHHRPAPPAIVPRKNLLVVSFGNIRAISGLESVQLLDAHQPASAEFARRLSQTLGQALQPLNVEGDANLPKELIFLEEVLRDTVDVYSRRLRLFDPIVESFLGKVANEVYSDTGVHLLVPLKDSLQSFEMQVKQSVDCLAKILDDDEVMLDLLLTEQATADAKGEELDLSRHEDVELLIGIYARQLSNIYMEVQYMLRRIQSKQEFVALALSGYRNRMVRMDVHLNIAAISLGLGTAVAGFFGMNLINGLEETPNIFPMVVVGSGMGGVLIAGGSLNYLSGHAMQKRASDRIDEIETLTSALSDMSAIDYAVKSTVDGNRAVDKQAFGQLLAEARQTQPVSEKEVDLLFDVFDRVKDGYLQPSELTSSRSSTSPRI